MFVAIEVVRKPVKAMHIISELKEDTGFNESGDSSVSVSKGVNCHEKEVGEQGAYDWMKVCELARVDEIDTLLH